MVVVADLSAVPREALDEALGDVRAADGVVAVSEPRVSPDGAVAVADVVPEYGATDERIPDLVDSLRDSLPEGAELTGDLPFFADISSMLADRLLVVVLFVVGVSVVLLMMMFRSVVVPVKAALMNLLSVSAAYGIADGGLPVGLGRGPHRARADHAGLGLGADPDLRDPVRPLHGLRGLPALPDPGALAGQR